MKWLASSELATSDEQKRVFTQHIVKAGRHLQEAILGSADLTRINLATEAEARAAFMEQETTVSQPNMLRGNPNHTGAFATFMPSRALQR